MRSDLCLIFAPPYSALFCPLNTMTKQKTPLTSSLFSSFFFFFSVLFFFSPPVSPSFWNSSPEELLEVPLPPEFAISVKAAIGTIRRAIGFVSKFENDFGGDLRLSNAISDCLDLLDLSADELDWALSASQNRNGKRNSTGNLSSNLRTWISAAMVNQDTCADGFDGTNSFFKPLVTGSLSQAASLVRELLAMVPPNYAADDTKRGHGGKNSPPRKDRKLLEAGGEAADVTVALDGSGDYTRIADAVAAAPERSTKRHVIYVKEGLYEENVEIKKTKWNLMIVGAGMNATVISGNRSFVDGWTTFRSATFAVSGRGFIGRDITIQNTAGPEKHQAVALRSDSDLSVYYRCAIKGYQDTLYTHTMRQFFRECRITGTVDFIFGDGSVVFQNCHILSRRGLPDQKNTVTAQGRKDPSEPTGFVIQFCNISTDPPELNSTATFLGRPWKPYSRTVIMQSYMGGAIDAEGWLEWDADVSAPAPAPGTLYYGEYLNYGPGAGLESRVKWPGFHVVNDTAQVKNFTVARFIDGNVWLPTTGVKYTAGLEL